MELLPAGETARRQDTKRFKYEVMHLTDSLTWRREEHAGIRADRAGLVVGFSVGGQVDLQTVLYELLLYQRLRT